MTIIVLVFNLLLATGFAQDGGPAAGAGEAAAAEVAGEAQRLARAFSNLYASLQAKGGIEQRDRPVIMSLRDRVSAYNEEHPGRTRTLAIELQLAGWLDDHDRVDALYERLLELAADPEIGRAWVRYFKQQEDRRRVGEILSRLVERFPEAPALRIEQAGFFKDANQYGRAIEILEQASLDPAQHPRGALLLSECLFAQHRFEEAVEALESIPESVLEEDPGLDGEVEQALSQRRPYLELWAQEQEIRSAEAAADDLPRAELITSKGPIVVELFENEAPNTVANFISLAESGFYDGTRFHRVIPNFMAQGGDPNSKPDVEGVPGQGGPGYRVPDEHDREGARMHFAGSLSMANKGQPHSGGSQFFLTVTPTPHLNGKHTVFGRVIEGLPVVRALQVDDVLESVTVLRKRDHEYEPQTLPVAQRLDPSLVPDIPQPTDAGEPALIRPGQPQ